MAQTPPKPVYEMSEEEFWKDYIRRSISESVSRIEKSGSTIQTSIGLFWTIYTAAAIVGTTLFKPGFSLGINILILTPVLLIMIAYYVAALIQVPPTHSVCPKNVDLIENWYRKIVVRKRRLVELGMGLLLATAIVIAVAIGFIVAYQPSKTPSMQVSEVTIDNQKTVAVSGYFPPNTKLDLIIEYKDQSNTDVVKFDVLTTPASGSVVSSITLADKPTIYKVTAQWTGADNLVHTLQETVNP